MMDEQFLNKVLSTEMLLRSCERFMVSFRKPK